LSSVSSLPLGPWGPGGQLCSQVVSGLQDCPLRRLSPRPEWRRCALLLRGHETVAEAFYGMTSCRSTGSHRCFGIAILVCGSSRRTDCVNRMVRTRARTRGLCHTARIRVWSGIILRRRRWEPWIGTPERSRASGPLRLRRTKQPKASAIHVGQATPAIHETSGWNGTALKRL